MDTGTSTNSTMSVLVQEEKGAAAGPTSGMVLSLLAITVLTSFLSKLHTHRIRDYRLLKYRRDMN